MRINPHCSQLHSLQSFTNVSHARPGVAHTTTATNQPTKPEPRFGAMSPMSGKRRQQSRRLALATLALAWVAAFAACPARCEAAAAAADGAGAEPQGPSAAKPSSAPRFSMDPTDLAASLSEYKALLVEAQRARRGAAAGARGSGGGGGIGGEGAIGSRSSGSSSSSRGGGGGGGNATTTTTTTTTTPSSPSPFTARREPPPRIIPLGGGFGYINATYFSAPKAAAAAGGAPPSTSGGCGSDASNDRACGPHGPNSFDAVRYVATMEELVTPKGYPLEAHEVTTSDGYKLTLYRIPYGAQRNGKGSGRGGGAGRRPVAFLQHGVTLASSSFVVLNANESLAFILADAGFDVWMGNTRGNTYSYAHEALSPYETAFWRFSIDEIALIDLPAMVDHVLATTGASKLAYAGHSQGCTLAFALLAAKPAYNEKFSVVAHMGPVVFVDDIVAPFLRLAGSLGLDQFLVDNNIPEFLPTRLTAPAVGTLCSTYPLDEVCSALVSFVFYGASQYITPDDYLAISRTWPSGVSTRNLEHWAQRYRERGSVFKQYNFGDVCGRTKWIPGRGLVPFPLRESCNREQYGRDDPPVYDLSRVTAPQAFFLFEFDVLTLAQDVAEVNRRLPPGVAVAQYEYSGCGHMDAVWSRDSPLAADLADVFYRFSPGTY